VNPSLFFAVFVAVSAAYALLLLRARAGLRYYLAERERWREDFRTRDQERAAVTVIVPMRDEREHARACIESLRAQAYPPNLTQVIVVDDGSTDGTSDIVATAIAGDPRFRLLRLNGQRGGKKIAIDAAIAQASGDFLLTTDADCLHDPSWISSMVWLLQRDVSIVAGPVLLLRGSGLFSRLQSLEFLGIMGVGAGLFGVGYPRLCNGANLAYRKSAFHAAGGFASHQHLASGDDEFLLHALVYRLGHAAEFNPFAEAAVRTPAAPSLRAFLSQRARWASKGGQYEDKRFVSFLYLLYGYFVCCLAVPVVAITSPAALLAATLLLLVKWSLDLSVLFPAARLLGAPIRLTDFVIAELLHPFYLVAVSTAGAFGRFTWKTRTQQKS
jgi:cellulose synthase/poly-beta-1,6-N-acetylglucosamine synthase-like glycosyltransferase